MRKKKTSNTIVKASTKPTKTKEWTEGRFRAFITSTLRGGFRKYPPKYEVLKAALWGKKLNSKTGRQAIHYTCANCKHEYPAKEIQIDHIEAVVLPEEGFVSWDKFIERLFCSKDNLQALCISCHKKKTKDEMERRKK